MDTEKDNGRELLREAGVSYSLAAGVTVVLSFILSLILLMIGVGQEAEGQDWYIYLGFLLPQVSLLAAALFFFCRTHTSVKKFYRGCQWYYFAVALILQFGLLFSLNFLNDYFVKFLELFGYDFRDVSVPSLDGWKLLPVILVIALLPAFFEETIFRGVVFGSMQKGGWGTLSAVLISGALFSLFHGNPEQTIYQFLCGAAFALLAQRAGSILPGMLAHFVNNALILILKACGIDLSALPFAGMVTIYVLSAVCLVGSAVWLILQKKNVRGGVKMGKMFFLAAAAGIAICAVEWIAALVRGIAV